MKTVISPYVVGTAITSVVILAYASSLGEQQMPILVKQNEVAQRTMLHGETSGLSYDRYTIVENYHLSDQEKIEILHHFASDLLENIEDMPIEFSEAIDDNFWNLI